VCRLLGYCARDEAAVADLIGEEALGALIALSELHADGWGMAWYEGSSREPVIRKSPLRADEPEFEKLARRPLSDLGLVHLRWATPGLAVNDLNTHPFQFGHIAFAHNGAVHPQDRLGEILPPEWETRVAGTTESERYLLLIMSRLQANGGDMVAAIGAAAAQIERQFSPNSLNAILLTPGHLYAIAWHDRDKVPAAKLRERGYENRPDEIACYFDLSYKATGDAVVIASTGWVQDGWEPLPNRHVLEVERSTLTTRIASPELAGSLPAGRTLHRSLEQFSVGSVAADLAPGRLDPDHGYPLPARLDPGDLGCRVVGSLRPRAARAKVGEDDVARMPVASWRGRAAHGYFSSLSRIAKRCGTIARYSLNAGVPLVLSYAWIVSATSSWIDTFA
jgi:predicted glutamine amidotransferase